MARFLGHVVPGAVEVGVHHILNLFRVCGHSLQNVPCDFKELASLGFLRFVNCYAVSSRYIKWLGYDLLPTMNEDIRVILT